MNKGNIRGKLTLSLSVAITKIEDNVVHFSYDGQEHTAHVGGQMIFCVPFYVGQTHEEVEAEIKREEDHMAFLARSFTDYFASKV